MMFNLSPGRGALDGFVNRLIEGAVPKTALDEEFTKPLLFALSIRLNQITGGASGMTFSARCHIARHAARHWPARLIWALIAVLIDLYCAVARGEVAHCETALFNHRRRHGTEDPRLP